MKSIRYLGACLLFVGSLGAMLMGCDDGPSVRDDDDEGDENGQSTATGGSVTTSGGPSSPPPESCADGELQCGGVDTIEECQNDTWSAYSCSDICELEMGFTSNGCSGDQCQCGKPIDQDCAVGVSAVCACMEAGGGTACTSNDMQEGYFACYQGDPDYSFVWCYSLYVEGNTVDCDAAASACL